MNTYAKELSFTLQLVRDMKPIFMSYFGRSGASWKADNTPLTQADVEINDAIIERINAAYPGDSIFGEEASHTESSSRVWVVDPIDGTQAFETGIPTTTIVVGLVVDGVVKVAVAYDPILDNVYHAVRGAGAFKNEIPIHCSDKNNFEKNYFATSSFMPKGYASVGTIHDYIDSHKGKVFNLRSFTYCALLVAEGKLAGAVLGVGRLYDISVPALIVEEAGGKATDLGGNDLNYVTGSDGILVTNGQMHAQLLDVIAG